MTLCIAAQAYSKGKHCLITSTDFAVETESSSADIEDKLGFDGQNLFMFAGQWNRCLELAAQCRAALLQPREKENSLDSLRRAVLLQKRKLANEYVGSTMGMGYSEFIRSGKSLLPDTTFARMVNDIGNITLECSLICAIFSEDGPAMYRIHETGMVESCAHFCAVGNGRSIAESVLFLRGHSGDEPLSRAIYQVYEAMCLGANAPGVSDKFALSVFTPQNNSVLWERLSLQQAVYLDECMGKFSLRPVGEVKELKLESFSGQWHPIWQSGSRRLKNRKR